MALYKALGCQRIAPSILSTVFWADVAQGTLETVHEVILLFVLWISQEV
jgi:hypothetical protein